jgi:two-component system KDP operon response regulator KdpE
VTGTPPTRVLVVDDEPQILGTLRINLTARGYQVITAPDGATALRVAVDDKPDVVVLDLGLPDLDGTDVIIGLRGWSTVPIIVLSARTSPAAKIQALDAGADDYVTKPFGMDELLARLRAAVRRSVSTPPGGQDAVIRTASFTIDLGARKVHRDGTEVHLTPTEWGLLEVLVRNPGRLVAQQQLLHEVWGPGHTTETHYLRVYLAQLRRKLEPVPSRPRHLVTEPGVGYRFEL